MTADGISSIFSVSTLPAHRQRGHGAAIIAGAVKDALGAGTRCVVLTPAPLAIPLYRRLGFHPVARWPVWTSASEPSGDETTRRASA